MRFSRFLASTAAAALMLGTAGAQAQEQESALPGSISGTLTLSTDYLFRGVSQTDEEASLQGSLTWGLDSGFWLGFWGSNVDFNDEDEASLELDLMAGYSNTVGNLSYTVGAYLYTYPGAENSLDYDFYELGLNLAYDTGVVVPTLSLFVTDEWPGNGQSAWYVTGGVKIEATETIALYANIGKQWLEDPTRKDAIDYNFGVTVDYFGLSWDLKYAGNDDRGFYGDLARDRVVFSLTKAF